MAERFVRINSPNPVQMCPNQKLCLVFTVFLCAMREHTLSLMIKCLNEPLPVHPDHNFTQEIHLPSSFPQPRPITSKITYLMRSSRGYKQMPIKACLEHFPVTIQSVLLKICTHQSASVSGLPKTVIIRFEVIALSCYLDKTRLILSQRVRDINTKIF